MPQRLAGTMSLMAFVLCLLIGGFAADNPLSTTIWRALVAMSATFVIALVLGSMAQKMLDEHFSARKSKNEPISAGESERR